MKAGIQEGLTTLDARLRGHDRGERPAGSKKPEEFHSPPCREVAPEDC